MERFVSCFGARRAVLTFTVAILGDSGFEANERFRVALSNPSHLVVAKDEGTGWILNDDWFVVGNG